MMKQETKATLNDLIARKIQKDADRFKTIDILIPSMGKTLCFKNPGEDVVMDVMDEMGEDMRSIMAGVKHLIYASCEMLQNPELHRELEITDPFDVVDAVFDLPDKNAIGEQLSKFMGIDKVGESVKNS